MRDPGLRSEHEAEIKVGLLVVLSLLVLVASILWVTGTDVFGNRYRIHAVTPQADRVAEGARIYLRGVDVGSVTGVELVEDRVVLQMELRASASVPRDSRARIQSSGFLGNQVVELVPGSSPRSLGAADTLRAASVPDLQSMASDLGRQAQRILGRTSRLLSDTTIRALRSGATDVSATMLQIHRMVEEERQTVHRLMAHLNRVSSRLDTVTAGPELQRTVWRIDSLTRRLASASEGLDASSESLASILRKVDSGQGSLGRLVNESTLHERATAAAENLQAASEEILRLARDLRRRPDRYLGDVKFSIF